MSNTTKVVCPNCGTEFALPEHEHVCNGVAIGKDSGLGTIYLTPDKKEKKRMTKAEERLQKLKAAGVDTSKYMVLTNAEGEGFLFDNSGSVPVPVADDDPILNKIKESGYVFNRHVDPRWITAQMFRMLNYDCYWRGTKGYDAALTDKGYWYQFKFLLTRSRDKEYRWKYKYDGELHRLARMERDKDINLAERGMYFNKERVAEMMECYLADLKRYINSLKVYKMEKKIPYVRIKGIKGMDGKGDVTLAKLKSDIYGPIEKDIYRVRHAANFAALEKSFATFKFEHMVPIKTYHNDKYKQSKVFKETYKGLGAYYTCENLIKFHGCNAMDAYGFLDTERSLAVLRDNANGYNSINENWRLFYFMKELIEINNFSPDWNK